MFAYALLLSVVAATEYQADITLWSGKPADDAAKVVMNSSVTYNIDRINNDTTVQTSNTTAGKSDGQFGVTYFDAQVGSCIQTSDIGVVCTETMDRVGRTTKVCTGENIYTCFSLRAKYSDEMNAVLEFYRYGTDVLSWEGFDTQTRQDFSQSLFIMKEGKVTKTAALHYDGNTKIEDADVTCTSSEFSVSSVYTDPHVYTSNESKAEVETLDTALKKAELYVFAGDFYFNDYADAKQVDMTTATTEDGAVVEQ